jgi:hypothetical protein
VQSHSRQRGNSDRSGAARCGWLGTSLAASALAALSLTGCASSGHRSDAGVEAIQELNLLAAPVALNFDGVPGPDGISLRLYATAPGQPKSITIRSGTLEVILFDGVVKISEIQSAKPLHVWSYPADTLVRYGQKTSIGMSYVLTPLWGKDKPARNRATVVARYLSPRGPKFYSGPVTVYVPPN